MDEDEYLSVVFLADRRPMESPARGLLALSTVWEDEGDLDPVYYQDRPVGWKGPACCSRCSARRGPLQAHAEVPVRHLGVLAADRNCLPLRGRSVHGLDEYEDAAGHFLARAGLSG
ncbi:hypothetical protein [Streptomyces zaomyceticus]|uniref:hypothetical protein n=1 Tax=Streptomyces zaomyceticus TaxID=68286 RepID=UPI0033ABF593